MTGDTSPSESVILHASAVSVKGRGLLIIGPSGSGKSALALQLMAWGADLVADDRTDVFLEAGRLMARCPPTLSGLIEARGVGILRVPSTLPVEITLVADLGQPEPDRLPPQATVTILGQFCPLVHGKGNDHFPASVLCYLKNSRHA